jgi:Amt family ammonium transporter
VQVIFKDAQGNALPVGWIDGNAGQIGYQLVGIGMAWAFALVGTIVLLKITDLVVGVRATEEQEIEGLDLTEHGEEAYNLEM